MRKGPGSVYDKWSISVVICDNNSQEEFEDTKGVIRILISKKNKQWPQSTKGQTTIYKTYT
jgi:hypothetical protein